MRDCYSRVAASLAVERNLLNPSFHSLYPRHKSRQSWNIFFGNDPATVALVVDPPLILFLLVIGEPPILIFLTKPLPVGVEAGRFPSAISVGCFLWWMSATLLPYTKGQHAEIPARCTGHSNDFATAFLLSRVFDGFLTPEWPRSAWSMGHKSSYSNRFFSLLILWYHHINMSHAS